MPTVNPPSREPGQSLPYDTLSPEQFEKLCCDLLAEYDGIENADVYGLPRKIEHGIDIRGERGDGSIIGLQAKRYKKVPKGKFEAWTKEFLKWCDHWRERKLDLFILSFTVDIRDPHRTDELVRCRKLCESAGFKFAYWQKSFLDRLLKKHPHLVRSYFSEDWEIAFCIAPKSAPTRAQDAGTT